MTHSRLFCLLLLAITGIATPSTASACAMVSLSGPTAVEYDFSSSLPKIQNLQLRFERTCSETAVPGDLQIEFWFSDDLQPQPYGEVGNVPFNIRRQSTDLLTTPVSPLLDEPIYTLRGASGILDIELLLAPGVASRNDVREISLKWRTRNEIGDIVEYSNPVLLSLTTLPSFSISLDNGQTSGTLNFGTLVAGDSRSVGISAKSTHPFKISLESTYGPRLRRVDTCGVPMPSPPDATNSIPISTLLDGAAISEAQAYVNSVPTGSEVLSFANLMFEVTIDPGLDPTRVEAGRYCNVLTLSISPVG